MKDILRLRSHFVAALIGAVGGGLVVAFAANAVPKMMSRMMSEMMGNMIS